MIDWHNASLEELPAQIWSTLESSTRDPSHPFRLAALGTNSLTGPTVRTVVLRTVDSAHRQLVFFTDARSPKVAEIRQHPRVTWLFYHPGDRVQIRAEATAEIHHGDEIALRGWQQTPIVSRVNYCAANPPGTRIARALDSLPRELRAMIPNAENTAHGLENFAVVRSVVNRLDWLWLNPEEHRRAEFRWDGNVFQGNWITP